MGIRWQDKVSNLIVLDTTKLVSIEAMILKAQLRWLGHVIRMDSCRLPRQILYGELANSTRRQGRPKKRFKDTIKESLKHSGFPACELETHALDRTGWRRTVKTAFTAFESSRREDAIKARDEKGSCCKSSCNTLSVLPLS